MQEMEGTRIQPIEVVFITLAVPLEWKLPLVLII